MSTTENDKMNSTLIKVEVLEKEYEVTLQQYQEAVQNYISSLTNDSNVYTALKGRAWWGTSSLSEANVDTKEECENMCKSSSKCTGATFNPVKRYCWTRTGDIGLSVGHADDYALVTQQKSYLSTMKYLNDRLISLNSEISNSLKDITPEAEEQVEERYLTQQKLNESYYTLLDQKMELDKQLQEYYSASAEENNQMMYADQQNMSFKMWALIMFVFILITLDRFFGEQSPPLSLTIWFAIIIAMIILTFGLRTPSGFFTWTIMLIFIFLSKMK